MAFHDILFPLDIASGASCTKTRMTQKVMLKSGHEERNGLWADAKRQYDVSVGSNEAGQVDELNAFWEGRRGELYSFRFKDYSDFQSCALTGTISRTDQVLGTGNGVLTEFQLVKTYADDVLPYVRTITKPVDGTVVVAVAGTLVDPGDYVVDYLTGIVTFDTAPASGSVTAGFEFDVPVRFDGEISFVMITPELADAAQARLIEDRGA